jgi:hypothetical protein
MMSIEDTGNPSASEALAAAMAQVGKLPVGMRYDTSPDYAVSGLASDKPGIPGLAEAARQFLENYPTPPLSGDFDNLDNDPSAAVPFTPILVSDRDQGEREALETLRLEKITDIEAALNQADEDSRPKLKVLLEKLEAAKGKDANSIRSAITSASLALSTEAAGGGSKSAGGGMEEEKTRLWGEIGKLNEAIKLDLEELHKRGLIGDEEYEKLKKERARLDKLDVNDPARLEGERLYNNRIHAIAEQANQTAQAAGDTHGQAVAQRTETHAQQQNQNLDKIEKLIAKKRDQETQRDVGSENEATKSANAKADVISLKPAAKTYIASDGSDLDNDIPSPEGTPIGAKPKGGKGLA